MKHLWQATMRMVSTELGEIEIACLSGYFRLLKYYNAYRALQNIKEDCALPNGSRRHTLRVVGGVPINFAGDIK